MLILVLAIAACGGGISEPEHELVSCSAGQCERACAQDNQPAEIDQCVGVNAGDEILCDGAAAPENYMGIAGCCATTDGVRRFYECVD